jgi:octaprenyl-diphosphate synthase
MGVTARHALPNGWGRSAALAAYAPQIARARAALAAHLGDAPAGAVLRPYFARGKMLRAQVVFAAADAVGGRPDAVIAAAEAIELLHGASLVHDDIIDGAARRRGLAALHRRLGLGPALVVGDELLLRAFATLASAPARHRPARLRQASAVLNELARACCRGQFEELRAPSEISEARYLAIVRGKTAAPFVAAGALGAILGGGTAGQVARIRRYAEELGIAFQIADDLQDLVGDARTLGKPLGNSLARGRPMLPIIYWRARTSGGRVAARGSTTGLSRRALVASLRRHGVFARVQAVQAAHAAAAVAALGHLPGARGMAVLRSLAAMAARPAG